MLECRWPRRSGVPSARIHVLRGRGSKIRTQRVSERIEEHGRQGAIVLSESRLHGC